MDKEREVFLTDDGFSEKELDLAVDKTRKFNQVKAGSIFDSKKKKRNKSGVIIDSQSQ